MTIIQTGLTFTGNHTAFTGRVEVIAIDPINNILHVHCTQKHEIMPNEITFSDWPEEWDYQVCIHAFEQRIYFEKEFPGYPPTIKEQVKNLKIRINPGFQKMIDDMNL